jgi:hypothetical protein
MELGSRIIVPATVEGMERPDAAAGPRFVASVWEGMRHMTKGAGSSGMPSGKECQGHKWPCVSMSQNMPINVRLYCAKCISAEKAMS